MNSDLSGRVVAITGASSGIGEATALACVAAGAAVSLAARRGDRIDALAQRIDDGGGKAVAITTDVGEEDQARAFVEGTKERLGRLDALVNNAGVMLLGRIEGADAEEWRRMVHVNLFGVLYTHARGAADHARAGRGPHRQRLLGGRPRRPRRLGRLQPHQVGRGRVLGGAAPGGASAPACA